MCFLQILHTFKAKIVLLEKLTSICFLKLTLPSLFKSQTSLSCVMYTLASQNNKVNRKVESQNFCLMDMVFRLRYNSIGPNMQLILTRSLKMTSLYEVKELKTVFRASKSKKGYLNIAQQFAKELALLVLVFTFLRHEKKQKQNFLQIGA